MARCFFFQAEDGIRDIGVTGVQTCALPISADAQKPPKEAFLAVAYSRSLHEYGEKAAYGGKATTLGQAKWVAVNERVKGRGGDSFLYKEDGKGIGWVRDGYLGVAFEKLKRHK